MIDNISYINTIKTLNEFADVFERVYKDKLQSHIASGDLYNSIEMDVVMTNDSHLQVEIKLADYYKYLEDGRKAGKWPPISAIEEWITIKPILPRPNSNGKVPTTKQLAYLIARKIGMEGIKPTNMMDMTLQDLNNSFQEQLSQSLLKDIDKNIYHIIRDGKMTSLRLTL